jgi:hypothetical protein
MATVTSLGCGVKPIALRFTVSPLMSRSRNALMASVKPNPANVCPGVISSFSDHRRGSPFSVLTAVAIPESKSTANVRTSLPPGGLAPSPLRLRQLGTLAKDRGLFHAASVARVRDLDVQSVVLDRLHEIAVGDFLPLRHRAALGTRATRSRSDSL